MRVLSLSANTTNLLSAMHAGDSLCGVSAGTSHGDVSAALPRVSSEVNALAQASADLRPDVVLLDAESSKLQSYFRNAQVFTFHPISLDNAYEQVVHLGAFIGHQQDAQAMVSSLQQTLETLRASIPGRRLRVYAEAHPEPPTLAGYWIPEVVDIAGGESVGKRHGLPPVPVTLDALRAADPDIIVLHWRPEYPRPTFESIAARPGWPSLRALHQQTVTYIPHEQFSLFGPQLVDGVRKLQRCLRVAQYTG